MLRFALLALEVLEEVVFLLLQLLDAGTQHLDLAQVSPLESGLLLQLLRLRLRGRLQKNRFRVQIVTLLLDLLQNLELLIGLCWKRVRLPLKTLDEPIIHDSEGGTFTRRIQFL